MRDLVFPIIFSDGLLLLGEFLIWSDFFSNPFEVSLSDHADIHTDDFRTVVEHSIQWGATFKIEQKIIKEIKTFNENA